MIAEKLYKGAVIEGLVDMNLPFDMYSCTLVSFPVYFCRLAI